MMQKPKGDMHPYMLFYSASKWYQANFGWFWISFFGEHPWWCVIFQRSLKNYCINDNYIYMSSKENWEKYTTDMQRLPEWCALKHLFVLFLQTCFARSNVQPANLQEVNIDGWNFQTDCKSSQFLMKLEGGPGAAPVESQRLFRKIKQNEETSLITWTHLNKTIETVSDMVKRHSNKTHMYRERLTPMGIFKHVTHMTSDSSSSMFKETTQQKKRWLNDWFMWTVQFLNIW